MRIHVSKNYGTREIPNQNGSCKFVLPADFPIATFANISPKHPNFLLRKQYGSRHHEHRHPIPQDVKDTPSPLNWSILFRPSLCPSISSCISDTGASIHASKTIW